MAHEVGSGHHPDRESMTDSDPDSAMLLSLGTEPVAENGLKAELPPG